MMFAISHTLQPTGLACSACRFGNMILSEIFRQQSDGRRFLMTFSGTGVFFFRQEVQVGERVASKIVRESATGLSISDICYKFKLI